MAGRETQCANALASIMEQTLPADEVYLYNNATARVDLTDNGKFYGLTFETEPCYYLTCDDDIIYPVSYIADMVAALDSFASGCIVTHHGRILGPPCPTYYRNPLSRFYAFTDPLRAATRLDVAGTGVSAFRTDHINPVSIVTDPRHKMTDLLISELAAMQGVRIIAIPRKTGYLRVQFISPDQTIFGGQHKADHVQAEIANRIYLTNKRKEHEQVHRA